MMRVFLYILYGLFGAAISGGDDAGPPMPVGGTYHFSKTLDRFHLVKEESRSEENFIFEFLGSNWYHQNATARKGMRIAIEEFNNIMAPVYFRNEELGSDDFELLGTSDKELEYVVPRDRVFMEYTKTTGDFKGLITEVNIPTGCDCAPMKETFMNGTIVHFLINQTVRLGCPAIACSWSPIIDDVERKIKIKYTAALHADDTFYIRFNREHRELLNRTQTKPSIVEFESELFESRIFYAATGEGEDNEAANFLLEISYDTNFARCLSIFMSSLGIFITLLY